jgi:N-acetylneuraminic acid mutarotase
LTAGDDQPPITTGHTAVWAGDRMIVWGGVSTLRRMTVLVGGMYDPRADRWTATNTAMAPASRAYHSAVWTGSAMIVWGGQGSTERLPTTVWGDGGSFDPRTNSWTTMLSTLGAGGPRAYHTATWATGPSLPGGRMIVWGGAAGPSSDPRLAPGGAAYDPAADRWTMLPTAGAPMTRCCHTAAWTGSRLLLWGGVSPASQDGTYLADGATYTP